MVQLTTSPPQNNPAPQNTPQTNAVSTQTALNQLALVLPASVVTSQFQSKTTLENLRKDATEAIRTGNNSDISTTNPVVGTFLKTLDGSGLSTGNQMKVLNMVMDLAEKWSDPFSSESLDKMKDSQLVRGLNPNNMTTQDAIKLAVGIGAAIVAESAKNAAEEQKKMQQIQAKIGEIPASVKLAVMAEHDLAHMTIDQIIDAVNRELAAEKKTRFGDTNAATTS